MHPTTDSARSATERKPGPGAGEFRFDAIASWISASTPVLAGGVVEVALNRRRRATETPGDLGDREALGLTEVVRKGDRSTALYDAVIPRRGQTGRHTVEVLAGAGSVSDLRPVIR